MGYIIIVDILSWRK